MKVVLSLVLSAGCSPATSDDAKALPAALPTNDQARQNNRDHDALAQAAMLTQKQKADDAPTRLLQQNPVQQNPVQQNPAALDNRAGALPADGVLGLDRAAMKLPASTSPSNRAAFLALALHKDDRQPLGGIGEKGIHLTSLISGTDVVKGQCTASKARFVLGQDDKASICLRVVHADEEQELSVIWQRLDGKWTPPAATLLIPAMHSFNTRAYVALRSTMVGNWRARVLSSDQVELGSITFEVTATP